MSTPFKPQQLIQLRMCRAQCPDPSEEDVIVIATLLGDKSANEVKLWYQNEDARDQSQQLAATLMLHSKTHYTQALSDLGSTLVNAASRGVDAEEQTGIYSSVINAAQTANRWNIIQQKFITIFENQFT